jgi:hypothetical protein
MSKVKNMVALQALIEEKRRTGFASDIAAANEADAVLDTIHKELIRLEAIEAAADKYWNSSSYIANSDGDCISCGSSSDDPTQHAEGCPHGISGRELRALLDRKP